MSKIINLPNDTIAEKIYKYRKLNNLYQKDLAKILGVSVDSVTGYEKGRTIPQKYVMKRLKSLNII